MTQQPGLFADDPQVGGAATTQVAPVAVSQELSELGQQLQQRWQGRLHLGTSSWHFPGWAGLVWRGAYPEATLSRAGLRAYARHPLLRCVSLDRTFYRALDEATYARLAAQVDERFRFVAKVPALVTDAQQREAGSGASRADNPTFLDGALAVELAVRPALAGLGEKLGVLVFQLSPLPPRWLHPDAAALLERLEPFAAHITQALAGRAAAALELRDAALLTPTLAALLRRHGWRCCLGVHDRMPTADAQRPMQRALWPGDFICRWNLQSGYRYEEARDAWAPFDRLRAEDPATRTTLARIARATLEAGYRAFITINNKAEGSAPLSVVQLARLLT